MSFDPILWSKLSNQQKSGGAGYVENVVLTYDGDPSGHETIDMDQGVLCVKISDTPISLAGTHSITLNSGEESAIIPVNNTMVTSDDVLSFVSIGCDAWVMCFSTNYDVFSPGVYGVHNTNDNLFLSRIECAVTHTIDPKFIPGAVLPIIELETVCADGAALSQSESEKLTAAVGAPAIISFVARDNTKFSGVFYYVVIAGSDGFFSDMGGDSFSLINTGDGWQWFSQS